MNILIVTDDMFAGGAAKHVVELSNTLHSRGNSVIIASGVGEYTSRLDSSITQYQLPLYTVGNKKNVTGLISSYGILNNLVNKCSFDIVHTHKRITNALIKCIRLPKSTRHITHFHNTFSGKKYATLFGDFSICCSDAVKMNMVKKFGCPIEKTAVVYYGIDGFRVYSELERGRVYDSLDISRSKRVISSIGLFAPYKDRENLIRAISLLKDTVFIQNVLFVIQGYGAEEAKIVRMISEMGLNDTIRIVKHDYDVESLMNISEFLILNSKDSEGFPIVILEAASLGKIHIGTSVGGIPEFVKNGITGLLIPPESPQELATSIITLLNNPEDCYRMGQNAKKEFIARYTLNTMVNSIEQLYYSLLQK
ncbi:MAG: glycosyltransferase family 4 protein [Bacteroidota bacterium]